MVLFSCVSHRNVLLGKHALSESCIIPRLLCELEIFLTMFNGKFCEKTRQSIFPENGMFVLKQLLTFHRTLFITTARFSNL